MLGSNGLYCIIKLHEAEKLLLFLGLIASSLEMFFQLYKVYNFYQLNISDNGNWDLPKCHQKSLNITPLGTFSMLSSGMQVRGSTHFKLLVALEKCLLRYVYALWQM